ncbi:MAG: LLM class flavin-dependent oxidoreductase [Alphaproteobacteria bacterium]
MKFGIYVASQWPQGTDLGPQLDRLLEQVRAARAAGFDSLWTAQHFLTAPMQMFQTVPLLARLAAEAEGMHVGPAIMLLPMLNPVVVAEEAATLDWLCGGNYVLAVGMGYRREEFEALGVPFEERAGRFAEAIRLIHRLWTEDEVDFEGRYYRVRGGLSLKPKRPGGPPIWIGGAAKGAVERAARLGDGWICSFRPTLPELVEQFAIFRAARKAAGLAPPADHPICREVYVGDDDRTALDEVRGPLVYKYEAYASWRSEADQAAGGFARAFDDFVRDRFIVGDAARVRDEIQRYRDTLGVDHMILRAQWPGLDQATTLRTIERLGRVIAEIR